MSIVDARESTWLLRERGLLRFDQFSESDLELTGARPAHLQGYPVGASVVFRSNSSNEIEFAVQPIVPPDFAGPSNSVFSFSIEAS